MSTSTKAFTFARMQERAQERASFRNANAFWKTLDSARHGDVLAQRFQYLQRNTDGYHWLHNAIHAAASAA